jgi:hypothetical protein
MRDTVASFTCSPDRSIHGERALTNGGREKREESFLLNLKLHNGFRLAILRRFINANSEVFNSALQAFLQRHGRMPV